MTSFARTTLAVAALALLAGGARAANVIDTGTPTGTVIMANTVDATNWLAEKFTLSSSTVVDSLSAYVLSIDSSDVGKSFTVAVYGNSAGNLPALNFAAANQGQLYQASLTYTADGWNTSATGLNWSLGAGTYWFALEADGSGPLGLVAPGGAPNPAQAVAAYSGGVAYATTGLTTADTFGLQVSAVPEPSGALLAFIGLAALARTRRRQA